MADPRHTDQAGTDHLLSLARHLGAAVALVAVMAGAFWAIGRGGAGDATDAEPVATGDPVTDPATQDPTDTGTPGDTEPPASPASPVATDEGTPTSTSTPTPTPTSSPSPADAGTAIPAGEVTVQVLDAVRQEGSTAAQEVADALRADGYRVVVVNPASRVYDVTTVFYSPGHEAAARQVAAAYGFPVVEPKPDNLSDSVRVHVVVGRDRA